MRRMMGVDSMVWMYGGEDIPKGNATGIFDDLWIFNTSTMQWSAAPRLITAPPKGKSRHSMAKVSTVNVTVTVCTSCKLVGTYGCTSACLCASP